MIPIEKNKQDLQSLCKKHKVDKLYLFGSATNESFTESSDLDFLVRFHKIELAQYFGNSPTNCGKFSFLIIHQTIQSVIKIFVNKLSINVFMVL